MPSFLREPLVIVENALTPEQCDEIVYIGSHSDNSYGEVGDGTQLNNVRKSGVSWFDQKMMLGDGQSLQDDILWPLINKTNDEWFGFDLTFHEANQFTTYKAPDEFYGWHCDGGPDFYHDKEEGVPMYTGNKDQVGTYRKLSYTIQLSHPDEYEGGYFDWIDPTRNHSDQDWGLMVETVPFRGKSQGTAIFFSSILHHRVTPVTRGKRHSLVGWLCGPAFK